MRCLFIILMFLPVLSKAQFVYSFSSDLRSLRMVLNDDWRRPAVITLGSDDEICFSFDEMSHTYHRYTYKITHCNSDWEPSELFEIDCIDGFNERPIEEWSNSENTTQLYTHYEFCLPNEDVSIKVSGNYKVEIFDDETCGDAIAVFGFSVLEPRVSVSAKVSGNTDVDFNKTHQQLSFTVDYSGYGVSSPSTDIKSVVFQNRRFDNRVQDIKPTYITGNTLQYIYNEKLIFDAGNEYRRFELTDPYSPGMNVERVTFFDSYYHAELYADAPALSYRHIRDENGGFFVNTLQGFVADVEADYALVHFSLDAEWRGGGDFYLLGDAWGNRFCDANILLYDNSTGCYSTSQLLKYGVYNYKYVWVPDDGGMASETPAENSFYNAENEYLIYIYHREFGGRYDKLVGVGSVEYKIERDR